MMVYRGSSTSVNGFSCFSVLTGPSSSKDYRKNKPELPKQAETDHTAEKGVSNLHQINAICPIHPD